MRAVSILITGAAAWSLSLTACSSSPDGGTAETQTEPAGPVLPFIADNYGEALAQARTRGLPIFVDTWAPW